MLHAVGLRISHDRGDGRFRELHARITPQVQTPAAENTLDHPNLLSGLSVQWGSADPLVFLDQTRRSCLSELSGATTTLSRLQGRVTGEDTLQKGDDLFERGIFGFTEIEYQDTDLHRSTIPLQYRTVRGRRSGPGQRTTHQPASPGSHHRPGRKGGGARSSGPWLGRGNWTQLPEPLARAREYSSTMSSKPLGTS